MSRTSSLMRPLDSQTQDETVELLGRVFHQDVLLASSDLAKVHSSATEPGGNLVDGPRSRSGRSPIWRGAFAQSFVVAVVLLGGALALVLPGVLHGPTGLKPAPTAEPTVSSERYADGIPKYVGNSPVLRGSAALQAASESRDSRAFYVGFWAGQEYSTACVADTQAVELDGWCRNLASVGDEPGVPMPSLGARLRYGLSLPTPGLGPVIIRVHTHDAEAAECLPSQRTSCEHVMVGDEVVWNGDSFTAPRPFHTAEVIEAFVGGATPPVPTACVTGIAGVPVVQFDSADGERHGVVAVFPTAAALLNAYPNGSSRGSTTPPPGAPDCASRDTGVFWLVRENLLVGVEYDVSVGPDKDTFVATARQALQAIGTP